MVQSGSNNVNYNTTPTSVTSQLQDAGTQFIVIARSRQSDQLQVWSSGDEQQTQAMFREARSTVDTLQPTG
jgi:outer membrane lipopolysaccharide assembly protein LptE/RlpB